MNIPIISVTSHPEHCTGLVQSAMKHGWDLYLVQAEWKGFGTKLIETYNYLKQHPEIEQFVFCDSFDVVVLGTPEEFERKLGVGHDKIVTSAEKGLWPPYLSPFNFEYRTYKSGFNYINSGLYYSPTKNFIALYEKYTPLYETDDQFWLNMCWLLRDQSMYGANIIIDVGQSLFNSHSFISEGEYGYANGRIQILGNEPIFIHSNAKTIDPKLDELI